VSLNESPALLFEAKLETAVFHFSNEFSHYRHRRASSVPGSATVSVAAVGVSPTASFPWPTVSPALPTLNHVLGETPRTAGETPALPGTKALHPQVQENVKQALFDE
jgi:hypothetical protein